MFVKFQEMFSKPINLIGKALDQAYAIFKNPIIQNKNEKENNEEALNTDKDYTSLNAYLTYVNLKVHLLMQDLLETRQKNVLFG